MAKKLIQVVYVVNDQALLKSAAAIRANEAAANKADGAVRKFGISAKTAGDGAGKSFLNLGNIWRGLIAIGITAFIVNLAKKTLDLGIKQEQLNIAFTTFLGSAEKARKLLAELTKFAIVTPFTPDQVNNAAKALLAFGVQAEKIIPTLKMLGDVSSGTGKDLTEMAIIFGQIRSTGRLMGQDLLQLINAGFNPLQIISQQTGKSVKSLKEEMEKGLISFEMVEGAFKSATAEGGLFFNLMEKQSVSVGGILSTVSGNIDEILKNLFTATSGPLKDFVDALAEISSDFVEISKSAEQVEIERNTERLNAAIDGFKAYASAFKDIYSAVVANNEAINKEEKALLQRNQALYGGEAQQAYEGEYDANLRRIDAINLEREAMQAYIIAVNKEKEAAETKEMADQLEREAKAREKVRKELEKRIKAIESADVKEVDVPENIDAPGLRSFGTQTFESIDPKTQEKVTETLEDFWFGTILDMLDDYGDEKSAELKRQGDEELELKRKQDEDDYKREKEKHERIKELRQEAFDAGLELLGQALMASVNKEDEETRIAEENFEKREKAAGSNRAALAQIRDERDKFEKENSKRLAEEDKQRAIKQMIIQGLLNTVRAIGTPPVPNFVLAGITGGYTLAQVGIAKSIGFKDGVIGLDGPGTGKSDSINARLSRGESVITAEATAASRNLLEAIQDRKIDDRILNKAQGKTNPLIVNTDLSELVNEYKKSKVDYYSQGHVLYKRQRVSETLTRHIREGYMS